LEFAARTAIPAAVFFLMWIVGLELTSEDFRRVVRFPKAALWGAVGQLIAFPLMACGLIVLVRPGPVMTAGIVLIAAAPGGSISNLLTLLGRGNVALSVSLTAVSNVIGVLTYPLLAVAGFAAFLGKTADIEIPVGTMMGQLMLLMLVPIGIGMLVRRRHPDFVDRRRTSLQRLSAVVVVCIVVFVALDQRAFFAEQFLPVAGVAALLTLAVMGAGWGLGRTIHCPFADRVAFLVEFSARNTAVAIVVAATTLGRLDYAAFVVAYFVAQMVVTLGVVGVLRSMTETAGAD
jgi:BASS family bile acid:Na+ symporter